MEGQQRSCTLVCPMRYSLSSRLIDLRMSSDAFLLSTNPLGMTLGLRMWYLGDGRRRGTTAVGFGPRPPAGLIQLTVPGPVWDQGGLTGKCCWDRGGLTGKCCWDRGGLTDMTSASILLSEEQLFCSICLQIFSHPTTLPCGHNFCKDCITTYWAKAIPSGFSCPVCTKLFDRQPDVPVNTLLSEFASQFKIKPVEVESTCGIYNNETHSKPHQKVPEWRTHKLMDPVVKLGKRTCEKHGNVLEIFCKSDQACICIECLQTDHKAHVTVPLESMCEELKIQLAGKKAEVQRMIQERRQDIGQIKASVDENNTAVEMGIADAAEIFMAIVSSAQRRQAEAVGLLKSRKRAADQKEVIAKAQQEISVLQVKDGELEELLRMGDNLRLFQRFPSVSTVPEVCDWAREAIEVDVVGIIQGAVDQMRRAVDAKVKKLDEEKLNKIRQRYLTDVTLDPDTAHPELRLSEDRRNVRVTKQNITLPNNPKRFIFFQCVFGKEGFSAGKSYYEVQVAGSTSWSIGVARGSMNRKDDRQPHNFWLFRLTGGDYSARAENITTVRLKMKPQRIGVFLDYEGQQKLETVWKEEPFFCFLLLAAASSSLKSTASRGMEDFWNRPITVSFRGALDVLAMKIHPKMTIKHPHRSSVVHQLKVGLGSLPPALGFQEVGRLAHVVFVQRRLERSVCRLGEHTLLLQDGEDTHRLVVGRVERHRDRVERARVQTEVDEDPVDALLPVLLLLQHKHVVVEELLQLLIDLKASDVQYSYEELPLHLGVQGPVDAGHHPLEHAVVHGLGQRADGVHTLVLVLTWLPVYGNTFGHKLIANFDPGPGDALLQLPRVDGHESEAKDIKGFLWRAWMAMCTHTDTERKKDGTNMNRTAVGAVVTAVVVAYRGTLLTTPAPCLCLTYELWLPPRQQLVEDVISSLCGLLGNHSGLLQEIKELEGEVYQEQKRHVETVKGWRGESRGDEKIEGEIIRKGVKREGREERRRDEREERGAEQETRRRGTIKEASG
ncbi:E3 ubiquitin-protein ligase TRIM39 [Merluccius polli]|uniref:E3 ubiquitin-protein ligase TRIM39 n=1 Tax=Merluccius polli TaxID=89951 RepID=A0AA47M2I3_MERPO|nr:E3 ubiquitin-protein ligase TRIM39 [Merluccius polli]